MSTSYRTLSDVWDYQIANMNLIMLCGAVTICMLVLLCTVIICKQIVTDQTRICIYDPQKSPVRVVPTDKVKYNGLVYHIHSLDTSLKRYIVYFAKLMSILAIFAVLISIPWEFIRLYQKALAERASQVVQGTPPECSPESMTLFESLKSLLRSQFSWTHGKSPCQDYYYATLVDPLWEVTPVMVLLSVFTRCFFHPLELASGSVAQSLRIFFSEIPAQWQPLFVLAVIIIAFLMLLMLFHYRLSIPLFLRLEPGSSIHKKVPERSNIYSKLLASKSNKNSNWNGQFRNADVKEMSTWSSSSTSFCNLNQHNHSALALQSYTGSREFSSQRGSSDKSFLHLSSAAMSSRNSRSLTHNFQLGEKSAVPGTSESNVKTMKLTRQSKANYTAVTRTSASERKSVQGVDAAINTAQLKPRKKSVAKKNSMRDTLWTPQSKGYVLSDSE